MVRYMADSIDGHSFTSTVTVPGAGVQPVSLFAGYVGGTHSVSSHDTGVINVNIDVDGTHPNADVLDIEVGDATPATAPGWVKAHNVLNLGYPAILYCNRSTITAVANALAAAGLAVVKDYRWWISTLDGTTAVPDMTGVTAIQAWSAKYFPNNIDLSIVYDDAWKVPVVTEPDNIALMKAIQQVQVDTEEIRRMVGVILGWQAPATLPDGTHESVINGLYKLAH